MEKLNRIARVARYLVTFALHFAHGSVSVVGVLAIALVGYQFARFGSEGLNPRSLFGYRSALPVITASAPAASTSIRDETLPPITPGMARVADLIAKRNHLSPVAVDLLARAAMREGAANQIDPLLILSIITVESRFNPYIQSSFGAQGLMQIVPRSHTDKMPAEMGVTGLFNPIENIRLGTKVLKAFLRNSDNLVDALQHYAGAAKDPELHYSVKVLQEYNRLCEAAGLPKKPIPPHHTDSDSEDENADN